MRIIKYTINIGDYDKDPPDLPNFGNYDLFRNNARNSRAPKILAHKYMDCDISVYYDANRHPSDVTDADILSLLGDADMCVSQNKKRRGVYDEIDLALGRVNNEQEKRILVAQGKHYRNIGVPENGPVYGYQPLIRRHTPKVNAFMEAWWAEICRWSYRDQVSFPVVLARHPEIKIRNMKLEYLYNKSYSHGGKTYPIVLPV
jgi:hypothetical protein